MSSPSAFTTPTDRSRAHSKRHYHNVYEASSSLATHDPRTSSSSTRISHPSADELLASRKDAPETLPAVDEEVLKELPDSDLLKAIHEYVADFYEAKGWGRVGFRMMDEGALIALGVLLEESVKG